MTIKNQIPVGAKWKATGPHGEQAEIWLESREPWNGKQFEIWNWAFRRGDSSGYEWSWTSSYRTAHDQITYRFSKKAPRFKRVKGT